MKGTFLPVALLALSLQTNVHAQLPYTSTSAVPWHLSRTYEIRENLELNGATVPFEAAGTGITWDFSALELPEPYEHTVYFEPASATPYHSTYPNANMVSWETDVFGNSDYNYFNNSAFELRLIGGVHVEQGAPELVEFCPNPFLVMDYPMSLGSGVQHQYNCPDGQGEVDDWVIMATGRVMYEDITIEDLVLWRSIFNGPGYADTSYFWTQADNVLYPVVRYRPGTSLRIRKPVSEMVLNTNEVERAPHFTLFPNPATDRVTLVLAGDKSGGSIWIYDALGRTVMQEPLSQATLERTDLDISGLAQGTYSVELRAQNGQLRQRRSLVKQ